MNSDAPYSIGNPLWPGISKLIEEAGEVQQVCGKLIAVGGRSDHWDGTNLRDRMQEEVGDLAAAIDFLVEVNGLDDAGLVAARRRSKRELFWHWHDPAVPAPGHWYDPDAPALRVMGQGEHMELLTLQAFHKSVAELLDLQGRPPTSHLIRLVKSLQIELAEARATIEQLNDDLGMACENPSDDCVCAGCQYAAERNA
jgi:NTP pyrophosphatase (non-canonical NTP hydrolase)